jgi:DNA helicase-2/ATP-dependent DNA helicase PcrA
MELSHLTENLNAEQQAAVTAGQQHMLVLAGAGSGKTRVLVHRIAWLMSHEYLSPHAILAVTFTNKAAYEMRGRIEALQGISLSSMWVGTFHGLSHRLLRAHWKEANLPQSFQILDSDDQLRIIKRVHRNLNLDEAKWAPKQSQWYINKKKDEGLRPAQIVDDSSFHSDVLIQVYRAYEEVCQRSGLVDFAELILRALELLEKNASISEHYQNRFRHILVDEFQDTNTIQYRWLQIFAGQQASIMAVGDDDQSIYSWRGAQVENIHRFTRDFKGVLTIRLEQNYRSTQTILDAANAVIENNSGRLGKNLWTEGSAGEKITLYAAFNERDEAYFIVSTIQNLMRRGDYRYQDVAILYRSNAQSRVFEEKFIDAQIPYRIYGGLKFFERMEIKDALAYLRVLSNRNDDAAFERIINTPTRGIGNATIELLRETARDNGASLWQSAEFLLEGNKLAARAKNALSAFLTLINSLENETKDRDLGAQTDHALKESGLMAHYQKDRSEQGISRLENLEELVNATSEFKPENEANLTPLAAFLAHVALETGEGQAEVNTDCVNLMTLHSAKGLEFPIVFISGMEENLFPHRMSTDEPNGLEEERRLCYVGVTRAKEKLYLTYAECRHLYGREQFNSPSRFIYEIPEKLIDAVRPTAKVSRPTSTYYDREDSQIMDSALQMGQRVRHQKFGTGTIINYEGSQENLRLQVKFDNRETKWLVASFANLEAI